MNYKNPLIFSKATGFGHHHFISTSKEMFNFYTIQTLPFTVLNTTYCWNYAILTHQIVHKIKYPFTLICTADHDDRVPPLHSYTFSNALQHAVQGNRYQKNPIFMNVLKNAGHDGRPTHKLINDDSDILVFLYRALL